MDEEKIALLAELTAIKYVLQLLGGIEDEVANAYLRQAGRQDGDGP